VSQFVADWGYIGIVLIVVLGNVGLPVPEETVLALAGYLVWSGRLQLLPVLVAGVFSAVVGDNLGYWLGHQYGRTAVERYSRWLLRPGHVMTAERWICRYGLLAVCAARFVSGLRFLAGPLAGAVGLPFRSFFAGNLLGAVVFVPYAVGIGYAIGYGLGPYVAHLQHTLGGIGRVMLVGGVAMAAVLLGRHTVTRIVRRGVQRAMGPLARRQCQYNRRNGRFN
jgi:membrane protein DedA with SNARE-associated domain